MRARGLGQGINAFQSAPRAHARGDAITSRFQRLSNCFNPRPALTRGATLDQGVHSTVGVVSIRAPRSRAGRLDPGAIRTTQFSFQSAPRAHARGDCGPANRQRRKPLLPHLREHSDSSRVRSDSIVKEQRKGSDFIAVSAEREIPAFESALGVRATLRLIADFKFKMTKVTESAVRLNRPVWRHHDVRSVSRPSRRGNRSEASLLPS